MQVLARMIHAALMSAVMVCMVTLIATFINLGLPPNFLKQWSQAYIIAWPVAATTGFLVTPVSRLATDRIMRRIGG